MTVRAVPSISFSATLPVKPSVTTTSTAPVEEVAPLDVAAEVDALGAAASSRHAPRRPPRSPCSASSPTESRPTRGSLDPEHGLAEGGAEEGELDQVLGADLGVGADVEKEHGACRGPGAATASAGRWTPFSRRSPKVAAAIVAPVEPGLAIASERPSATSAAARTIEASFLARTAGTGSSSLAIHSAVGTTSIAVDAVEPELASAGPKTRTRIPSAAAGAAPSASDAEALLGPEAVEGHGHGARTRRYSSRVGGSRRRRRSGDLCASITSRPA